VTPAQVLHDRLTRREVRPSKEQRITKAEAKRRNALAKAQRDTFAAIVRAQAAELLERACDAYVAALGSGG
jgi:hypothetical protein